MTEKIEVGKWYRIEHGYCLKVARCVFIAEDGRLYFEIGHLRERMDPKDVLEEVSDPRNPGLLAKFVQMWKWKVL